MVFPMDHVDDLENLVRMFSSVNVRCPSLDIDCLGGWFCDNIGKQR